MVRKDVNHPSVVFYSIGNEIIGGSSPTGVQMGRALAEKVREGSTVLLDYEVKEFGGRPFNMTKRLTVTEGGTSMPAPSPQPYPYPRGAVFQQALSNGPPAVNTDKHIFVTGVVGRAMGSGRFDPEDIGKLTQFACTAWTEFFQ
jgi:hypothetical protein